MPRDQHFDFYLQKWVADPGHVAEDRRIGTVYLFDYSKWAYRNGHTD